MARYRLLFERSVAKDLRAIPKKDVQRILKRIEALAANPRACDDRTKRSEASLKPALVEELPADSPDICRIRQGPYRITHEIQDDALVVIVVKVAHRSNAYR
jgi:mRNA interferase RelE/StbE